MAGSTPDGDTHNVEVVVVRPDWKHEPFAHHSQHDVEEGEGLIRVTLDPRQRYLVIVRRWINGARACLYLVQPAMSGIDSEPAYNQGIALKQGRIGDEDREFLALDALELLLSLYVVLIGAINGSVIVVPYRQGPRASFGGQLAIMGNADVGLPTPYRYRSDA